MSDMKILAEKRCWQKVYTVYNDI